MMPARLKKGDPIEGPGRWKLSPSWNKAGETAFISCPGCGTNFDLSGNAIDHLTSKVTPEVECPVNCGFKGFIVLKRWTQRKGEAK